ncbi:hypothetical protein [Bermanella sp. R86510]|uniref:hypothetical protein n=1 Tax=unclassified Bermanella TaxID=2627862 RepID=UPI0037C95C85
MIWIAAGTFGLGFVFAYFMLAQPARKLANSHGDDLQEAKGLLENAQSERQELQQKVADLEYKLKEQEKDLAALQRKS